MTWADDVALIRAAGTAAGPYDVYERMRNRGGILRSGLGHWIVVDHETAVEVLESEVLGNNVPSTAPHHNGGTTLPDLQRQTSYFNSGTAHMLRRQASVSVIRAGHADAVSAIMDEIPGLWKRARSDAVSEFSMPIATTAASAMLGFGNEFLGRVPGLLEASSPLVSPLQSLQQRTTAEQAVIDFTANLALNQDDTTARWRSLVNVECEYAGRQSGLPAASVLFLLLAAVHTTTALVASSLATLNQSPLMRERCAHDRANVRSFLREQLRLESPVQAVTRRALSDVVLGGARVRAGELLVVFVGSANRDPSVFARPNDVSLESSSTAHLAFGAGAYRCPGAALALQEAELAVTHVLDDWRPVASPVWAREIGMRRLVQLRFA